MDKRHSIGSESQFGFDCCVTGIITLNVFIKPFTPFQTNQIGGFIIPYHKRFTNEIIEFKVGTLGFSDSSPIGHINLTTLQKE
jgi:hypothetical protein